MQSVEREDVGWWLDQFVTALAPPGEAVPAGEELPVLSLAKR